MAGDNILAQIHEGMRVHTADGQDVGKITQIWFGTDPSGSTALCDEELCSRLEVHHGWLGRTVLYIPYNAISHAAGTTVTLGVNAAEVQEKDDWHRRPRWFPQENEVGGGLRF